MIAETYGTRVIEQLSIRRMFKSARGAGQERQAERRSEPLHQPRGVGPNGHDADVQARPARRHCTQGPGPRNLPVLLGLWIHHAWQPRGPGRICVQEPGLRVVRQRRPQRVPECLASVPDRPHRGDPGCWKSRCQARMPRQVSHRKIGRNLLPTQAQGLRAISGRGRHWRAGIGRRRPCSRRQPWVGRRDSRARARKPGRRQPVLAVTARCWRRSSSWPPRAAPGGSCRRCSGQPGPRFYRRFARWGRARIWARLHRVILDELGAQGQLGWSQCAIKVRQDLSRFC